MKGNKKLSTIKYEVDPYNQLTLINSTTLPKFRQVLEGRFKTDKNNNLIYVVKKPLSKDTPHQVKLKGKWSLDKNNDLVLTLDKQQRASLGNKVTLSGKLLKATKDSLEVLLTTKTKDNQSSSVIKLNGTWQANKYNQLTFNVKKEKNKHDILTLKGGWQLNNNNQITYTYKKSRLLRKQTKSYTLTFKGHWDIKGKKRISYVMDKKEASRIDFKASFSQFKSNYIKYKIGISTAIKPNPKDNVITLFGQWKLTKSLGLTFQVKNKQEKPYYIKFGAEAKLTKKDTISFKLKDVQNKDLQAQIELNHKILKGAGEGFIRLLKENKNKTLLVGVGFGW
jgi:hypothetical protein